MVAVGQEAACLLLHFASQPASRRLSAGEPIYTHTLIFIRQCGAIFAAANWQTGKLCARKLADSQTGKLANPLKCGRTLAPSVSLQRSPATWPLKLGPSLEVKLQEMEPESSWNRPPSSTSSPSNATL